MNKRIKKYFDLAKKLSKKSNHHTHKLGCVVFKGNSVVAMGFNKIKTHPKSPHAYNMLHAEIDALIGADPADLKDAEAIIYRENKSSGNVGLAKPCKVCAKILEDVEVKRVYYTTSEGYEYYDI